MRGRMKRGGSLERYCREAVRMGAKDARVIRPSSVVTAPWVRMKCRFGCGGWGGCLTCPPNSPTPKETRKVLDCYKRAILVHTTSRWQGVKAMVVRMERSIFLGGFYKALALGSGPCNLCRKCNMKECRHPDRARPSMEACGIDVYATARGNGFPIEVVRTRHSAQNYYGLVLVD